MQILGKALRTVPGHKRWLFSSFLQFSGIVPLEKSHSCVSRIKVKKDKVMGQLEDAERLECVGLGAVMGPAGGRGILGWGGWRS